MIKKLGLRFVQFLVILFGIISVYNLWNIPVNNGTMSFIEKELIVIIVLLIVLIFAIVEGKNEK